MSDFDDAFGFDAETDETPADEFGFDYDTGDVLYHTGEGFALGPDGKQYMETGDGHVIDLETDKVHYAPPAGSGAYDDSGSSGLWPYAGAVCALVCLVYLYMVFNNDGKYLVHALVTGFLAYLSFSQCR